MNGYFSSNNSTFRIQRRLERLASLREEETRLQGELIRELEAKRERRADNVAFSRHWTGLEILRHGQRQFVHVDETDYIAARITNLGCIRWQILCILTFVAGKPKSRLFYRWSFAFLRVSGLTRRAG